MVTAVAQPPASDPLATSGLPVANVRQPGATGSFPSDEFDTIQNVPVFAEHATTLRDGRRMEFGLEQLKLICDRCNQRIAETGDYAAITIGHTPDPKVIQSGQGAMPEVVGFAGPYRIGTLGTGDRTRYAILADFHLFKSERDRIKRFPRRSPELWLEDRIEDMFLDPIALLGAEAPRLDMGLLYSAARHGDGRLVEKYAAVGPAAGNVSIPGHVGVGVADEKRKYESEPPQTTENAPMANIGPDDIRMIIDALEQTDWVQWVKQNMGAQAGNNASVPPPEMPPAAPPAAPPGGPSAGAPPATPPPGGPPAGPPEGAPPAGPPEASGGAPPEEPPAADAEKEEYGNLPSDSNRAMWAQVDEHGEGRRKSGTGYAKGRMKGSWHQSYSADGSISVEPADDEAKEYAKQYSANADDQYTKVPPDGSDHEHEEGTPFTGDKKSYSSASEALDDIDDEEIEQFMAGYCKKRFQAGDGDADGDDEKKGSATVVDSSVEPDNPGPLTEGDNDDEEGEAAGSYQKGSPPVKFSRSHQGGVAERYARELSKVRGELGSTRKALEAERVARVEAERYSRLTELRQQWAFDLADELEGVKGMTDQQFDRHCTGIRQHYKRIPLNVVMPNLQEELGISPTGPEVNREKYSRRLSEQALRITEAKRAKGDVTTQYEMVLAALHRGEKVEV